jgi:hypothetical protein
MMFSDVSFRVQDATGQIELGSELNRLVKKRKENALIQKRGFERMQMVWLDDILHVSVPI